MHATLRSALAALVVVSIVVGSFTLASAARAQTSSLWGREGERWDPLGRLPDASFAGYHAGRDPIPDVPEVVRVRDFGARPDDDHDDTREIQRAIDEAGRRGGGAVVLERGRYEVGDVLRIERSGVVLRGAGREATTLHVTHSLSHVLPGGWSEAITRSFGFVQIGGGGYGDGTNVTADAPRGARSLALDAVPADVVPGVYVRLRMDPDEGDRSLWDSRHEDRNGNPHTPFCDEIYEELGYWVVRVLAVEGRRIVLEQPLRTEVRTRWHPRIQAVHPIREVGVERLGISFVHTPYPGHHLERGYNAIDLSESGPVVHAWVRDVLIENADNGINVSQAKHVTVRNVRIVGERGGYDGHHAFSGGIDCLYEDLDVDARFWHAVTFNERTTGTVVSRGTGAERWSLDHHSRAQLENVITDLDASYDWISGGGACSPRAGARHTYWRFAHPLAPPSWVEIQTNLVGRIASGVSPRTSQRGAWIESVAALEPRNLFEAQRARRLAIENVGRFAGGDAGVRSGWDELTPERWAVRDAGGERTYWLATSRHAPASGAVLGERTLLRTQDVHDVTLSARARMFDVAGAVDRPDAALVLSAAASGDAYVALFDASGGRSGIVRVRGGGAARLAAAPSVPWDAAWHTLVFRRAGTRLEMSFDGRVLASIDDDALPPGRVGLGSRDDSVLFDDVAVDSPEPLGVTPSPTTDDASSALPFTWLAADLPDADGVTTEAPADDGAESDPGEDGPGEPLADGSAPDAGVSLAPARAASCSATPRSGSTPPLALLLAVALALWVSRARTS